MLAYAVRIVHSVQLRRKSSVVKSLARVHFIIDLTRLRRCAILLVVGAS